MSAPIKFYRFVIDWWLPRMSVALVTALVLVLFAFKFIVPAYVWGEYQDQMPHHKLAPPDAGHGAGSSDIFYASMTYDCRAGDILVKGLVPDAEYWQFGIYDKYVRAVEGGHLNNRTVRTQNGKFELRITQDPAGRDNVLDCRHAPTGILIYRVVLPDTKPEIPEVSTG